MPFFTKICFMCMIHFTLIFLFASSVLLLPAAITYIRNVRDCSASVVVPKFFGILSIGAILIIMTTFASHFRQI
jgi:hypothetical protein